MEFAEAHARVLDHAQRVASALDSVDPTTVTRDNWETELAPYLEAVEAFETAEPELYAALYGETSAKGRIREYLRDHIGSAVTSDRLARVSGISEYARRLRELRVEEGFVIDSTRTRAELGTHDYFMVGIQDTEDKTRISAKARYEQLKHQSECEVCGRDVDADGVRYMEVDHIDEYVMADDPDSVNAPENLQTLCNECHTGKTAASGVTNDVRRAE